MRADAQRGSARSRCAPGARLRLGAAAVCAAGTNATPANASRTGKAREHGCSTLSAARRYDLSRRSSSGAGREHERVVARPAGDLDRCGQAVLGRAARDAPGPARRAR